MIINVPKIGDGSEENYFRPDTIYKNWVVVAEYQTSYDIEVFI